jgi:endonuclease/exonuclease/phosphatase family metal-dependent hydrolase
MKWVAKLNPDVVSLNEVERYTGWGNIDQPAVMAGLMKQYTGKTWYYRFGTLSGASKGIGNLLLSRFPIEADEVRLLSHGRSAINVMFRVNGHAVNLTTAHLYPDSRSYRLQEIGELTAWQRGLAEQRIVVGDFNATATSTENAEMKQTYYDSWAVAQAAGTAVAFAGNTLGYTRGGRIDFIYYSHGAGGLVLRSSQVFDTRDAHGVTPSDHRPVMSIFTVK